MRARLRQISGLVVLLFLVDQLYRWLHPEVNVLRACLVGLTAFGALRIGERSRHRALCSWLAPAWRGSLAVFASAFASVLLIQAGWLVSRSAPSVVVHVALLAFAYLVLGLSPGLRVPQADRRES